MCLTIDLSCHRLTSEPAPNRAIFEAVRYKIVKWKTGKDPKKKQKKTFTSVFQYFVYELNKTYLAKFSFGSSYKYVDKGIHSYTADGVLKQLKNNYQGSTYVILKCIIPANTKCYEGNNGDYVSESLTTKCTISIEDFKKGKR